MSDNGNSLLDFARMMERFESHQVSFVSVTQQFNTAHSMGRLTLNREKPQSNNSKALQLKRNQLGAAEEYRQAFEKMQSEGIHPNHLELPRAHYASPDHTTTWAQLAERVGYQNGSAVNL